MKERNKMNSSLKPAGDDNDKTVSERITSSFVQPPSVSSKTDQLSNENQTPSPPAPSPAVKKFNYDFFEKAIRNI